MLLVGVCGLMGTLSGLFLWASVFVCHPWLRATTLLWGGVLMRLHLWPAPLFLFFMCQLLFLHGLGSQGVFSATPWGVSQGLVHTIWLLV